MSGEIAALDSAFAAHSEEITMRLVIGTGANVVNVDCKCRARVDAVGAEQMLIAGVTATDLNIIISPTQINAAQWPGGQAPQNPPPFNPDPRIPRPNGPYKVIARGAIRSVAWSDPKFANNGELVRINMRVTGAG
jgi:hypothetical protein